MNTITVKNTLDVPLLINGFISVMQSYCSDAELAEIDQENKRCNDNTCASHDYLDANEVMMEAMQRQLPDIDVCDEKYHSAWNAAWSAAKERGFSRGFPSK